MKLGTQRDGTRDGTLVVATGDGSRVTPALAIAGTLQQALDHWDEVEAPLRELARRLETGAVRGEPLHPDRMLSPLPRAFEFVDGSAYLNHVRLVRKARGAEIPPTLETEPLVYQGGSSAFLAPTEDIPLGDPAWGLDFEGEVAVILGDVPQGTAATEAGRYVKLVLLCNDLTLRNLVPAELARGFGFFQSKPASSFSPLAVTPDELGGAFRDGRLHHRLRVTLNGKLVGDPEAGPEMHFSFHDLVAHIARTRSFCAGTVLGSGTVSNADRARGISCLAERRTLETLDEGAPRTPWMKVGDRIVLEMLDESGASLFGTIDQKVTAA